MPDALWKVKKGQARTLCSSFNANLRGACPLYKTGRYSHECRGFEQGITVIKLDRTTKTIYHCKHDPPKAEQLGLF